MPLRVFSNAAYISAAEFVLLLRNLSHILGLAPRGDASPTKNCESVGVNKTRGYFKRCHSTNSGFTLIPIVSRLGRVLSFIIRLLLHS